MDAWLQTTFTTVLSDDSSDNNDSRILPNTNTETSLIVSNNKSFQRFSK